MRMGSKREIFYNVTFDLNGFLVNGFFEMQTYPRLGSSFKNLKKELNFKRNV